MEEQDLFSWNSAPSGRGMESETKSYFQPEAPEPRQVRTVVQSFLAPLGHFPENSSNGCQARIESGHSLGNYTARVDLRIRFFFSTTPPTFNYIPSHGLTQKSQAAWAKAELKCALSRLLLEKRRSSSLPQTLVALTTAGPQAPSLPNISISMGDHSHFCHKCLGCPNRGPVIHDTSVYLFVAAAHFFFCIQLTFNIQLLINMNRREGIQSQQFYWSTNESLLRKRHSITDCVCHSRGHHEFKPFVFLENYEPPAIRVRTESE